jgi:hypothetical protein
MNNNNNKFLEDHWVKILLTDLLKNILPQNANSARVADCNSCLN